MKDYSAVNKKWWNDVTPIHKNSSLYNLSAFKKGKSSLEEIETRELTDIKGKTMLHLLCHFGMDSLSWSRKGAAVTGVDISDASIRLARKLSKEIKVPAKFICSDVFELPQVLNEKFDIVYASYGVLCWLPNLRKFAKIVSNFLKEGGTFYIVELHPFTNMLSYDFKIYFKYFQKGPFVDDSEGTYADWNAKIKGSTYVWNHTMSELLNAFIDEGMSLEFFHEFPFTMYEQFEGLMEKNKTGQYILKDKSIQIPLLFSLKAAKRR